MVTVLIHGVDLRCCEIVRFPLSPVNGNQRSIAPVPAIVCIYRVALPFSLVLVLIVLGNVILLCKQESLDLGILQQLEVSL